MNTHLRTLAGLIVASALVSGQAQTAAVGATAASSNAAVKKAVRKPVKKAVAKKPSVESQIEQLRTDLQNQIQGLKQQLSDRDQQLQQAQQAAAAAQAAADQAKQAAAAQQQTSADTTQAVTALQGDVTDLKANTTSLVTTIQDNQKTVKAAIENPSTLHYKGITLTPGGFLAAESVWRERATGGGINTQFTGIPLENADAAKLSEFFATGRQSRIALLAEGKLSNVAMRGYYEVDWLGAGVTSNNNQSNSYVLRQRQLWAQAAFQSGWTITTGQMWSLVTETKTGMDNRTENLPMTIDPQYTAGFAWTRQYGFRVTKQFGKSFWLGASAENPQVLIGGTVPANFLLGSTGNGGGLFNLNATYSFNYAPDMVIKTVIEPGWGHYEIYGLARVFRNRIYPNATATIPSSAGAYNDTTVGGGIGGALRVPVFAKKLDVGLKGLWGQGVGRYGSSTLPDVTARPDGTLALLRGVSALGTLELHATPRLDIYANYGGDYAGRRAFVDAKGKGWGYGSPLFDNSGCGVEPVPGGNNPAGYNPANPGKCAANNRDIQEATIGYWYDFYKGSKGRFRQGLQYAYFTRQAWSGLGGATKGVDNMFWTSIRYYLP